MNVKPSDKVSGLKVAGRMGSVYFCIKNSEGIAGWFDAYAVQSGAFSSKQNMRGDFLPLSSKW